MSIRSYKSATNLRSGWVLRVAGGMVLTAAHCVGRWVTEQLLTSPTIHSVDAVAISVRRFGDECRGAIAKLEVYEPFGDIAVLASEDCAEFDELFRDRSRLIVDLPRVNELLVQRQERVAQAFAENSFRAFALQDAIETRVRLFVHKKEWRSGRAKAVSPKDSAFTALFENGRVEGGTSGAPLVNLEGTAIGLL